MNTRSLWLLASLLLVHCGDDTLTPPQITVDLNVGQFGERSIAEEAPSKEFNILVQNKGEETLKISSAKLHGDQNCAFEIEGPDKKELGEDGSAFIRVSYKPTLIAKDNVNLIIKSNSEKKSTLRIPICGEGKRPEDIVTSDGDTDAEEGAAAADDDLEICDPAPDDQPDCESADADTAGE